ncbi:MAG: prepilin-type N-terminal cleavage/methylation domain-containing protein [Leptolyngbyaceae cyanobacterium CSU_1_3]|nr:prepilin-type N-terminal cleavage/methylation domain-containing protein [Leptolyngbyaceae cyanobacterium CSU_1_3]
MKSELKAKFLQHLAAKKKDQGFTLIELLVVIIIIGILSAIALPSFLNQANKAKQSEARQYVGTLNRTQQAYFLENSTFATSITSLAKPVKGDTTNYRYADNGDKFTVNNFKATNENVIIYGTSLKAALKSYVGMVAVAQADPTTSEATTLAVLCESKNPTTNNATTPTLSATELKCTEPDTIPLGK